MRYTDFMVRAYEEIIEFIASGNNPETVASFQASSDTKGRVAELILKEKDGIISIEEISELDHYLQLEHLMRLAKAHAQQYLKG